MSLRPLDDEQRVTAVEALLEDGPGLEPGASPFPFAAKGKGLGTVQRGPLPHSAEGGAAHVVEEGVDGRAVQGEGVVTAAGRLGLDARPERASAHRRLPVIGFQLPAVDRPDLALAACGSSLGPVVEEDGSPVAHGTAAGGAALSPVQVPAPVYQCVDGTEGGGRLGEGSSSCGIPGGAVGSGVSSRGLQGALFGPPSEDLQGVFRGVSSSSGGRQGDGGPFEEPYVRGAVHSRRLQGVFPGLGGPSGDWALARREPLGEEVVTMRAAPRLRWVPRVEAGGERVRWEVEDGGMVSHDGDCSGVRPDLQRGAGAGGAGAR